jgi:predicted small lipoprotein YifL
MKSVVLPALALLLLLTACGDKPAEPPAASVAPVEIARSEAPADASVFFVSPQDGETVTNPIRVVFGIEGMSVVAAGTDTPHSGHHHLLIDTGLPDLGLPIPKDAQHVHFGDGSTETEITLEPGEHTLQMLLGDHRHIPHDPPLMSDPITIKVE